MKTAQTSAQAIAQTPAHGNLTSQSAQKNHGVQRKISEALMLGALAVSPLALTACGGGGSSINSGIDFVAPAVTKMTDISDPAHPVVIPFDPQSKTYNIAFYANQSQVFAIDFNKPLSDPTNSLASLMPSQVDANGNPTGLASLNPVSGMTVSCPTNNPNNATSVTCTVTTDATFNLGNAAAKIIPLKFFYRGSSAISSASSVTVADTVSAVPVVAPVLPASMVTTADAMGASSVGIDLNQWMQAGWTVNVVPNSVTNPNAGRQPTATAKSGVVMIAIPGGYGTANISASAVMANSAGSSVPFTVTANRLSN